MPEEWKKNYRKRDVRDMKIEWGFVSLYFLIAALGLFVLAVATLAANMAQLSFWFSVSATTCALTSCAISIVKRE